eukprot:TRINITY_DN647_c0_g1_i1.p1 TRINITY_DN647_c0_g1~~TRINITY_DN647_c0_g1_i1.p1  ORF type:complete len:764 (+),score=238.06 TRINITY_DN647_c0_g1_i1:43-2292(+)
MEKNEIVELCMSVGVREPERLHSLGISKASDLLELDLMGEMKVFEAKGLTYMEMRRLRNAAEVLEVNKGPKTVKLKPYRMEAMTPPAKFADRFVSLTRGCYCWRIVEQVSVDKQSEESVLVITAEFLLVCSLEGSITTVVRCQDVELVAIQECRPPLLALKVYEKYCEPTILLSLVPNMNNPANEPLHPVHALNFVRKPRTRTDLELVKVPTTMDITAIPCLAGTFEEGENYLPPHMKFQILQQTRSWPQGGAASLPTVEYVFSASNGETNVIRLGKSFGSTGKLQWYVDGKAKMPDIREVKYEGGVLKFRKGETVMTPDLPDDEQTRDQCLRSIGGLAARARIRCTNLPTNRKKVKKDGEGGGVAATPPLVFTDLSGMVHRLSEGGSNGGIQWWMGATLFNVKYLSYDGQTMVGGSTGPNAKVADKGTLVKIAALAQKTGVMCVGFPENERCNSVFSQQSGQSVSSWSHDPYNIPGQSDSDEEVEIIHSPSPSDDMMNSVRTHGYSFISAGSDPMPHNLDDSILMQPVDPHEPPPSYTSINHLRTMSMASSGYAHATPTPPPALLTPVATPSPSPSPSPPSACFVRTAVLFKHGRRGEFTSTTRTVPGEYVLVETGMGLGIGLVTGERKGGRKDDIYKVHRKATAYEVGLWKELVAKEDHVMATLLDLAYRMQTGITVHRCEYPFDQSRITVHYSYPPNRPRNEALLPQLQLQASAVLGCAVLMNNCFPEAGQAGDLIDTSSASLPQL